jgi:glycosyltransferase involved in cell wall biosynthesis
MQEADGRPWLIWASDQCADSPDKRRIACIMTFHNQSEYLPAALESVLNNFLPEEVLVIDDCSAELESKFAFQQCKSLGVTILRLERNVGPAGARMVGARLVADVDFIMFMDSDDVLSPDYLARLRATLDNYPDAAFAMGVQRFFHKNYFDSSKVWPVRGKSVLETLDEPCISASGVLFRKSAFDSAGGFRIRMKGGFEDWDLGLRLASLGFYGVVCKGAIYHYRRPEGSQMARIDPLKRAAIDCALWANNREHVKAVLGDAVFLGRRWWPAVAECIRHGKARTLCTLISEALSRGGIRLALLAPLQIPMFFRWLLRSRQSA